MYVAISRPVDYSESVQQSYQRGEVSLEMMAKYFRRDDIEIHCAKTMCKKLEENCKKMFQYTCTITIDRCTPQK